MSEAITVALIGLGGSALGSIAGILVSSRLTQYRLEQLEKRVQAHNSLIERTYRLEQEQRLLQERVKNNARRIEEMEHAAV